LRRKPLSYLNSGVKNLESGIHLRLVLTPGLLGVGGVSV